MLNQREEQGAGGESGFWKNQSEVEGEVKDFLMPE